MNDTVESQKMTICPYCHESRIILESTMEGDVTIVCAECNGHFIINLMTMKTTKKRTLKKAGVADNDTALLYKLKCPHGCKHYILYDNKVDAIVGDRCSICRRFFRGNLLYGRTWSTKAQRN